MLPISTAWRKEFSRTFAVEIELHRAARRNVPAGMRGSSIMLSGGLRLSPLDVTPLSSAEGRC